jgi:prepilin-type N-terminal cleavage/methylation domain-containing protein
MNPRRTGFTLVEMAIVLVIIGLLVGGILVGRELIVTASIRAQVSQMAKYTQATNAFKTKYDCLPGDCLKAVSYGLYSASTGYGNSGDGNHFITQYTWGTQFVSPEWVNFWYHLKAAGMSDYSPEPASMPSGAHTPDIFMATMPKAKLGGGVYIVANGFNDRASGGAAFNFVLAGGNGYFLALPGEWSGQVRFNNGLTPLQAFAIDQKLDDGRPYTGNVVRAINYLSADACANSSCSYTWGACATATEEYNVVDPDLQCNLAVLRQF